MVGEIVSFAVALAAYCFFLYRIPGLQDFHSAMIRRQRRWAKLRQLGRYILPKGKDFDWT